jgi:hypothetical protein
MLTRMRGCGRSALNITILREALLYLRQFSFIEIIENPELKTHLAMWLGKLPDCPLTNETQRITSILRTRLNRELTPVDLDFMENRTRPMRSSRQR